MKIGLVSAAAMAALVLSTTAFAQAPASAPAAAAPGYVEKSVDGSQSITFVGDPLQGDENSIFGFAVRPAPGPVRAGLIRPRANFVSELLKSVENL